MCYHLSLLFAYLTSMATTAALVVCVMYGEIFVASVVRQTNILLHNPNYLHNDVNKLNAFVGELAISLVLLTAGTVALVSLIFSVLLVNGISKRQPGLVKAYLTFGSTLTMLVAVAAFCHMYAYDAEPARYALIACGVYLTCLGMVRVTYKNMLQAATCD